MDAVDAYVGNPRACDVATDDWGRRILSS